MFIFSPLLIVSDWFLSTLLLHVTKIETHWEKKWGQNGCLENGATCNWLIIKVIKKEIWNMTQNGFGRFRWNHMACWLTSTSGCFIFALAWHGCSMEVISSSFHDEFPFPVSTQDKLNRQKGLFFRGVSTYCFTLTFEMPNVLTPTSWFRFKIKLLDLKIETVHALDCSQIFWNLSTNLNWSLGFAKK